jgi:Tol biopolymer transport system component
MILSLALSVTFAHAAEVSWTGGGHGSNPQWSSDGSWLAFEVNNNADKVDLYVVKINGGTPGQPQKVAIPGTSSSFSGGGGYAANPVWHPRGLMIFEAANAGGKPRLYSVSPGMGSAAEFLSATQAPGSLQWPAISADGSQVAFTSSNTGKGDVYVFAQQGGKVAATVSTPAPESAPRFAPDGKTLVFSKKNEATEDVYAWTSGGTAQKLLAGGPGDQTRPRVVGDKVVYFTNERGDELWDIAVVPLAGGERRIVAKDVRLPQHSAPSVTPDGASVLYGTSAPTQDGAVFITRLDGSGGAQVSTGGLTAVGDPVVVSAGGRTLLAFTALPKVESDWRQLHVIDVTGKF